MKAAIPSKIITPIIRKYIEDYQSLTGGVAGENIPGQCQGLGKGLGWGDAGLRFASAVEVLAEEAEISAETIRYHLRGKKEFMSFGIADKLLCAMDLVHLWHCEPLSDYYYNTHLVSVAA